MTDDDAIFRGMSVPELAIYVALGGDLPDRERERLAQFYVPVRMCRPIASVPGKPGPAACEKKRCATRAPAGR